jgi:hypothetical protein
MDVMLLLLMAEIRSSKGEVAVNVMMRLPDVMYISQVMLKLFGNYSIPPPKSPRISCWHHCRQEIRSLKGELA